MATTILRKKDSPKKIDKPTREQILRNRLVELWCDDLGPTARIAAGVNHRLGLPEQAPHCIGALLVRGVERLCTEFKLQNPVIMTHGTQDFWYTTPVRYQKYKGTKAKKGDIGILVKRDDIFHGHAFGFREDESNIQRTIEYNVTLTGVPNGDGVYALERDATGTLGEDYRGSVDVVAWILAINRSSVIDHVKF